MAAIPANGIIGDPVGSTATAMEGLGGVGIVNELLLQSQTGVLVLFPQVPSGVPASFTNLRARGGFLVSASMATGKRTEIDGVTIISEAGQPVTILSPWASSQRVSVVATPGGEVTARKDGLSISWGTHQGVSYSVQPTAV